MPLMREYVEVVVEEDLLPQVIRELLAFASNPNLVEVSYGSTGRVILVHPEVADAWYQWSKDKAKRQSSDLADIPIPVPVQRLPGSPRNIPSASPGEES
jgi:hypothetical protein